MAVTALHIYPSSFTHESRMLKETKTLVDSGLVDHIIVGAIWEPGLKEHEQIDARREVWRVRVQSMRIPIRIVGRSLGLIEWGIRLFWRFRRSGVRVVQCHSLSCLPIGVLFKIFAKSKLVYDAHELETERVGWTGLLRMAGRWLEAALIRQADSVIVVGEMIGEWYRNRYGLKHVSVIRNIPYAVVKVQRSNVLRRALHIDDDAMVFIYQGVFSAGRSVELLLRVFARLGEERHVVFMGYGPLEELVKDYDRRFPNIHLQPAVPLKDVLTYTSGADVGLCLIENVCLSYHYCLPNKLFEYLFAGLPVVVSDCPEMVRIVEACECGWKAATDEDALVDLISSMSDVAITEKKKGAAASRHRFGWHTEGEKLIEIYQALVWRRAVEPSDA